MARKILAMRVVARNELLPLCMVKKGAIGKEEMLAY